MKIETHGNVDECQCSVTTRGLIDILLEKPFYAYIAKMRTKPVNLSKFMVVAYASSAPACIIPARLVKPHVLKQDRPISMQCNSFDSDFIINAGQYTPSEHHH